MLRCLEPHPLTPTPTAYLRVVGVARSDGRPVDTITSLGPPTATGALHSQALKSGGAARRCKLVAQLSRRAWTGPHTAPVPALRTPCTVCVLCCSCTAARQSV